MQRCVALRVARRKYTRSMEDQRGDEMQRPRTRFTRQHQRVETGFVLPVYGFGEALGEVDAAFFLSSACSQHERRFPVVVTADHPVFVARVDEKLGDGCEAMFRSEVQRRVGAVFEVGIA